jgi:hypothetical protein
MGQEAKSMIRIEFVYFALGGLFYTSMVYLMMNGFSIPACITFILSITVLIIMEIK